MDFSPYLVRLLNLYDEKRRRFQGFFALLLVGTLLFFFFVFIPYFTLLGNRLACQQQNAVCSQIEAALLNDRFSEVTTSWGNIPISTAEFVALAPLLMAVGFTAVTAQLLSLIRLRQAIEQQVQLEQIVVDTALIAPMMVELRPGAEALPGLAAFLTPPLLCLYALRLIFLRRNLLRIELPYAQSAEYYLTVYALSLGLLGFSLVRLLVYLVALNRRDRQA
jgi:hypothetical protein